MKIYIRFDCLIVHSCLLHCETCKLVSMKHITLHKQPSKDVHETWCMNRRMTKHILRSGRSSFGLISLETYHSGHEGILRHPSAQSFRWAWPISVIRIYTYKHITGCHFCHFSTLRAISLWRQTRNHRNPFCVTKPSSRLVNLFDLIWSFAPLRMCSCVVCFGCWSNLKLMHD